MVETSRCLAVRGGPIACSREVRNRDPNAWWRFLTLQQVAEGPPDSLAVMGRLYRCYIFRKYYSQGWIQSRQEVAVCFPPVNEKQLKAEQIQIGGRIREARKAAGFTQMSLSEAAGISLPYMGAIERGDRSPTLLTLLAIKDALGIPLVQLLCGDEISLGADVERLITDVPVRSRGQMLKVIREAVLLLREPLVDRRSGR